MTSTNSAEPGNELALEQAYLEHAYRCLAGMQARVQAAADDAASRAAGDWDATRAHVHLTRRLGSLDPAAGPLCFGRIDEDDGPSWYIGRRHVEDDQGGAVVVDWRTPVAVAFYRATFSDALGLRLRRRFILEERAILDLLDEDFISGAGSALGPAMGLPDPLLAEIGRARTGVMRDIVATIAAEQDRIIRAPIGTTVVVQGGPGTGKTAVGLHRAAYLLFDHRSQLERQGVLVLGPNQLFLSYISQVLPSLGEVAVVQTTLRGLRPELRASGLDSPAAARLKGDARMSEVVRKAALSGVREPDEDLVVRTRWGVVTTPAPDVAGLVTAALGSGGALSQRRSRFRRAVSRSVTRELASLRGEALVQLEDVEQDLRKDRAASKLLDRVWPQQSAMALVRRLLTQRVLLRAAALGVLSGEEQALVLRKAGASMAAEPWSEADLALVDEAEHFLTGPPRRYGHVVVDEAQDLSAMEWRMVARRSIDGTSVTVLGDRAQATSPAATGSWAEVLETLGASPGAAVEELRTGYRVPVEIMGYANRLLPHIAPGLAPTSSVRKAGSPPVVMRVDIGALADAAAAAAGDLHKCFTSVGIIAAEVHRSRVAAALAVRGLSHSPPGSLTGEHCLSLLAPEEVKGLEFDAVVVVEPGTFSASRSGLGLLYIALTRAVQHLTVVHAGDLPVPLQS